MIEFLPSLPTYDKDAATKIVWGWLQQRYQEAEGVCYYKHTVVKTPTGVIPELVLLVREFHPLIVRCLPNQLNEITAIDDQTWAINSPSDDSPLLQLDDCLFALQAKFNRDRLLRNRLRPVPVLALPLISKHDFEAKFGNILQDVIVFWADSQIESAVQPLSARLSDQEWRHTRSVAQGVSPLKMPSYGGSETAETLSEAIKILDRQIALLDTEQEKAAIQIAPGPQRIRGLAGTGKTVLLAMKAANIHQHYPDRKILFTFNTQSLYNQARSLITKFYRINSDDDPDWDKLHIRHAWGGRSKPGVYYDLCGRLGIAPLDLVSARNMNRQDPFQACCDQVVQMKLDPEYDFVLVDEAQDFPKEYLQILYRLSHDPHCIYWAYDELQSLSALEMSKPEELFGTNEQGEPLVVLDDDPYPGGIDKDYVLYKSYRCPQAVLMVAHAIGLGLYNRRGPVQMLDNKQSWEAIGYAVESEEFQKGEAVVISRPAENSPNPISEIYQGQQKLRLFGTSRGKRMFFSFVLPRQNAKQ